MKYILFERRIKSEGRGILYQTPWCKVATFKTKARANAVLKQRKEKRKLNNFDYKIEVEDESG